MASEKPLMNPEQAAWLLDRVIYEQVLERIDLCRLQDLEAKLSIEISRLQGTTDEQMLSRARGLISRALRRLADHIEGGSPPPPMDEENRYWNAICAEFDPARLPAPSP